jgi:hypothetical protein
MSHSCPKWNELVEITIYIDLVGNITFVDNDDPYTISYEDKPKLKFDYCPYCKSKL